MGRFELAKCCFFIDYLVGARIIALVTFLIDIVISVYPYMEVSAGSRDFRGYLIAYSFTDLIIFGGASIVLFIGAMMRRRDLLMFWIIVQGFRVILGIFGLLAIIILCLLHPKVLSPGAVVLLFLLDISIGAVACASLAVNELDQRGTFIGLGTVALSVIFIFSSFMLILGTLERSASHFVPFIVFQGIRIMILVALILGSLISGHINALGYLIFVLVYLYFWIVVVELYFRLDDYQKLDDTILHI